MMLHEIVWNCMTALLFLADSKQNLKAPSMRILRKTTFMLWTACTAHNRYRFYSCACPWQPFLCNPPYSFCAPPWALVDRTCTKGRVPHALPGLC